MTDVISKIFEAYNAEGWNSGEENEFERTIQTQVQKSINSEVSDFFEFIGTYDNDKFSACIAPIGNPEYYVDFTSQDDILNPVPPVKHYMLYVDQNSLNECPYISYPFHESLFLRTSPDYNNFLHILEANKILEPLDKNKDLSIVGCGFKILGELKRNFFGLRKLYPIIHVERYPLYIVSKNVTPRIKNIRLNYYEGLWENYPEGQIYVQCIRIKSLLFLLWPKLAVYWDRPGELKASCYNSKLGKFKNMDDVLLDPDYWNVIYFPTLKVKKYWETDTNWTND